MFRAALLAASVGSTGCGRVAFDPAATLLDGDTRADDGGLGLDGFVRGDVVFSNNVAFISDAVVVPGMLGGAVEPADAACQNAAAAAGLPGTYVAWLSSPSSNAIDRLAGSRGWVRADGIPFVDQTSDLIAGRILSPLTVGVDGALIAPAQIMTATSPSGVSAGPNCTGLTVTNDTVLWGRSTSTGSEWTSVAFPFVSCANPGRLYCFGTGGTSAIVIPAAASARRAFVSTPWTPGGGLASADARCATDASAVGLTGTFRAALATSTSSASSRFADGSPWKRLDGMLLAPTAADLLNGAFTVPLNVDLQSNYLSGTRAWLGASTWSGVGTDTCLDWSVQNNGNNGVVRYTDRLDPTLQLVGCGIAMPLLCLEQ